MRTALAPDEIRRITPPLFTRYAIKGIQAEHGLFVSVMLDCEEDKPNLSGKTGRLFITDDAARKRYCVLLRGVDGTAKAISCAECDKRIFLQLKERVSQDGCADTQEYTCPGGLPTIGVPIIERETGTFVGAILAGQKRPRENLIAAVRRFRRIWKEGAFASRNLSYGRLLLWFLCLRQASDDEQASQRNLCETLGRQLSLRYTYFARQRIIEEQHAREQLSALAISSKLIEVAEVEEYWQEMETILATLQEWLGFDWGVVLRDGGESEAVRVAASLGDISETRIADCRTSLSALQLARGVSSDRAKLGPCLSETLPSEGKSWYLPLIVSGTVIGLIAFGIEDGGEQSEQRESLISRARERLNEIHNLMEIEYKQLMALANERSRRERLEANEKELSTTVEKLNSTLVILTHQMSRPFIGVIGVLSLLRDSYRDVSPKRLRRIIDTALAGTKNTSLLAHGVSKVLAAETSGVFEVHPEEIDAHAELRKLADMMKLASGRGDIDIEFVGRSPHITMDRESFLFVFYNLLDNALKYGRSGTRITLASEKEYRTDRFALKVKSRGIPIAPEDTSKVFEKFWRGPGVSRTGQPGLGIGCWAAREHMLAHGGELELEVDGDLSVFVVYPPDAY